MADEKIKIAGKEEADAACRTLEDWLTATPGWSLIVDDPPRGPVKVWLAHTYVPDPLPFEPDPDDLPG